MIILKRSVERFYARCSPGFWVLANSTQGDSVWMAKWNRGSGHTWYSTSLWMYVISWMSRSPGFSNWIEEGCPETPGNFVEVRRDFMSHAGLARLSSLKLSPSLLRPSESDFGEPGLLYRKIEVIFGWARSTCVDSSRFTTGVTAVIYECFFILRKLSLKISFISSLEASSCFLFHWPEGILRFSCARSLLFTIFGMLNKYVSLEFDSCKWSVKLPCEVYMYLW